MLIDLNEHVIEGELAVKLQQLELKEAIIDRYIGLNQPTHQRGHFAINVICILNNIPIIVGGYMPFREIRSDYRALWVKLK